MSSVTAPKCASLSQTDFTFGGQTRTVQRRKTNVSSLSTDTMDKTLRNEYDFFKILFITIPSALIRVSGITQ